MNTDLINILGLAAVGSLAGLIGGVIFLVKDSWARLLCHYAVPFAAGVLLSTSLLHLLPEAVHGVGESAYLIVLVSLLASFLFEQYFAHLHHHEHKGTTMVKSSVPLIIFGDTIHNFIDGVAIAAAYLTDPVFGVIVAFASFLHETPHEIGDFGILIKSGWSKRKTFLANFFSALATFPGALFVFYTFKGGDVHETTGALLAVSAGVFLYLGASDFLPEVGEEKENPGKKILLLIFGVILMYVLKIISPEH